MEKVFIRGAYNYDGDEVSASCVLVCDPGEDRTQQQFKEESDINEIVRRFGLTGQVPEGVGIPMSGDFTDVSDFHTAMNMVRTAEAEFMKLPAEVRARFSNDPGAVIQFLDDPANLDEAVRLGLVARPAEVVHTSSRIVTGKHSHP